MRRFLQPQDSKEPLSGTGTRPLRCSSSEFILES